MTLTEESPELYLRRGDYYGFTCAAPDYWLTQVALGWHIYFTHIRDDTGAWRRARPADFNRLPQEMHDAGTCLMFDDASGAWGAMPKYGPPTPTGASGGEADAAHFPDR